MIVHLISGLHPKSVLDVGKGFGKYGFLIHEYCGIDNSIRPDPAQTLREQSRIVIDAVECNPDYLWPHLSHLYRRIYEGRIEEIYRSLPRYDLILMSDVIEHLRKDDALSVVRHFVDSGSVVVISTPRNFFQQELFESPDEHHLSHWTPADFRMIGHCVCQNEGPGRIYLLSGKREAVRGFGNSLRERLRRIYWTFRDELNL